MPSARTNTQMIDLIVLGITWLHERMPDTSSPGWTGNGVLQTMRFCGAISDAQCLSIAGGPSSSLRAEAVGRSRMVWPNERRQTHRILATSDRHLAVLVTSPPGMKFLATPPFYSEMILKPGGYRLLATERGREYAHAIAGHYQPLTPDVFWGRWQSHRRGMRGMHARWSAASET